MDRAIPEIPPALAEAIDTAFGRRDFVGALSVLAKAEAQAPNDVGLKMQRAVALRMTGDPAGSLEALSAALALDPYNLTALLAKGAILETLVGETAAAETYRDALKIVPSDPPPRLAAPLARARAVVAAESAAFEAYLRARLDLGSAGGAQAQARVAEGLRIFSGTARPVVQQPLLLHYPQLPAICFPDRSLFPWLPDLEANTEVICTELQAALAARTGFAPYIEVASDAPVNQWAELNRSDRWTAYFLWRDGERQDAACEACPRTAALMDHLPLARQPGFAPTVVFSALAPNTHIPPHTGSTNTRLLVHLPLILPGPARFRVGNETRDWRMGEAWVFDDTIEHEAWNDADALRVILIIDVWNPYLEPGERDLVSAMLAARAQFLNDRIGMKA